MKHIKRFDESITKLPQYTKGEILVFLKDDDDLHSDISMLAKVLGYKVKEQINNYFVVETPVGKEDEVGQDFVDNYPEFISSYSRRDIRQEELNDLYEQAVDMVSNLDAHIGYKFISDDWNLEIDNLITHLQSMKIK